MADIRSFFGGGKPTSKPEKSQEKKKHSSSNGEKMTNGEELKKKKKRIIIDSDSDEDPLPAKLRKEKSYEKESSEEPIPPTPEIKKKHKDKSSEKQKDRSEKHKENSEKHKEKSLKPPEKASILNPTTASDFFSSTTASVPVKRKKESDSDDPPPKKEKSSVSNGEKIHKEKLSSEEHKKKDKERSSNKEEQNKHDRDKERSSDKEELRKKEKVAEKSPSKIPKSPGMEKSKVKTEEKLRKEEGGDSAKKSSLASKLSSKVKDSEGFMSAMNTPPKTEDKAKVSKSKSSEERKSSGEETKMKQSLQGYIDQAKEKEKKAAKKQKETAAVISPEKTTPAKTPAKTPSASTEGEAGDSETPKAAPKKNYWAYKARAAPTALGSKTLPELQDTTLEGLTFVITGILEAFDREEVQDYIKRYGGKVTGAVSGKTSYLIIGREPGESKITKADKVGTKRLDEDGFLELCESKAPKKKSSPTKSPSKMDSKSPKPMKTESPKPSKSESFKSSKAGSSNSMNENVKKSSMEDSKAVLDRLKGINKSSPISTKSSPSLSSSGKSTPSTQSPVVTTSRSGSSGSSLLWVDKYKPKAMKQIVGQQGEKSNANKLKKWLLNWKTNNGPGAPKKNFNAGKEDGSIFRAALLSGPPGVGKTTTATLVCEDVGFSYIEMNASDTRGKKALETEIKESLSNITVNGMMSKKNDSGRNHVLIMDEVDGMAGNEDRGGMSELIQLIKKSQIPIICMCNDRGSQKMRSLVNYTFDLRCYKPRVEQIKAFALSVACKEGVKIPPNAMENIVVGANQDIRQVLHNLQMWTATDKTMNYDESKAAAKEAEKNIKIDNFEVVKKLFSSRERSSLSINDRVGLFFNDYSIVPLFVQENYAGVNLGGSNPRATLEALSRAADSIADSDRVDKVLRSQQAWKLLPLQAMFSTVIPSLQMNGYMGGRIEFPKWLGKNSTKNKHDRILQELKMHMAISADCMKADVNMDYLPVLKHKLTTPLVDPAKEPNDAAKEVVSFMGDYNLNREDWDNIVDISKWGNETDITSKIPSKVKAAFTRLYNKEGQKTPYAMHQTLKKSKGTAADSVGLGMEGEEDEGVNDDDDDDDDDITKDAMIKKMKKDPKAAGSSKTSKTKTADGKSSKGKGTDSKASGKKKK